MNNQFTHPKERIRFAILTFSAWYRQLIRYNSSTVTPKMLPETMRQGSPVFAALTMHSTVPTMPKSAPSPWEIALRSSSEREYFGMEIRCGF